MELVVSYFVEAVLGRYRRDTSTCYVLDSLQEVLARAQAENPSDECSRRRALRAFELMYISVMSTNLRGLEILPYPRAEPDTIDTFTRLVSQCLEDALVEGMDEVLAGTAPARRDPRSIRMVENKRVHEGGTMFLQGAEILRDALKTRIAGGYWAMGRLLADVSYVMVMGLSTQLVFAEELLRTREM